MLNKVTQTIDEIMIRLEKTNDKNNITREISDLILDEKFLIDMNKQKFILPLRNGKIFDITTNTVSDRTIEHKFDYECDCDYIELNDEQRLRCNMR